MNDTKSTTFTRHVYDRFPIPPELCSREFNSFTTRMWLDNCDENNDILATSHTYEEYRNMYFNWLVYEFIKKRK